MPIFSVIITLAIYLITNTTGYTHNQLLQTFLTILLNVNLFFFVASIAWVAYLEFFDHREIQDKYTIGDYLVVLVGAYGLATLSTIGVLNLVDLEQGITDPAKMLIGIILYFVSISSFVWIETKK